MVEIIFRNGSKVTLTPSEYEEAWQGIGTTFVLVGNEIMSVESISEKLRAEHHKTAVATLKSGVTPELFQGDPTFELLLKQKSESIAKVFGMPPHLLGVVRS